MRYNIITKPPKISDAEISDKADFQSLLDKRSMHISQRRAFRRTVIKLIIFTSIVLSVGASYINVDGGMD